jgi:polysaccharide pyruvyl transferase WcaK-like protein
MIFYPIILAQMFNRPSVLLGISTGPSTSKLNNRWIVKILKNTPIFVRERYSLQWLVSIGIPQSNISLVPDFGFYWHKLEPSSAEIAFKKEYLSNSRLNIGVIINAKQSDMETYYMKTMASLCDFLIEHKNARILFLPLSRKNKSDADTISLNHLIRLLKRKEETIFVPYISSPVLFRDISRQLDLVISSRLHGIILSRPAPVVAITRGDTSYRLTGVMDKLGLPQFTSSLENESDFDNIKKLIDIALVNSVTIRSQQQIQIQKINEDLEKTMEILKTTIPY